MNDAVNERIREAQERQFHKSFTDLAKKVEAWAEEKDLIHAENANKQFMKFMEEAIEFKEAMTIYKTVRKYDSLGNCNTKYWPDVEMEMGDILVTLIILSKQLDIDLVECLEMAYEKISKRKGRMIDGIFVKEADLGESHEDM